MEHRTRGWSGIAVVMALATAAAAGAGEADPFATAHSQARQLLTQKKAAEAAKVYGTFAATHARDPLAPVALILQGIVLRRDVKDGEAARAAFAQAAERAGDSPLGRRLKPIARAWLARLQMEAIDQALRQYYVKHVWYPETLDELARGGALKPADLMDPWGKPFAYETGKLRWAPKVPRQKYRLSCSSLEGDSKALERTLLKQTTSAGDRVQLRGIVPTAPRKAIVATAEDMNKRVTVTEGSTVGSATVAAITPGGVLLVDGEAVAFLTVQR